MKRILVFIFTFISLATMAQTQLFRGKSSYIGDILYSINGLLPLPVLVMMIQ